MLYSRHTPARDDNPGMDNFLASIMDEMILPKEYTSDD